MSAVMNELSPAARPRVLFVDDEPRILITLKALFRNEYEVVTANSGAEAVERLRAQSFDVIVSDQRMPQMTGVELLRAAASLCPRAIRLLLTGYADLNAIIGSINEGEIFRFVSKPWMNEELRGTLAAAVRASQSESAGAITQVAAAGNDAGARASAGIGVLVLHHDAQERERLRRVLGRERPVHVAQSFDDCLSILEQQPVGVIVSEIAINGQIVTPLLGLLKQHQPALVSIVITAHADAGHAIDLINQGQVYRLLREPISDGLLSGAVNVALRRFEILRENPDYGRRYAPAAVAAPVVMEKTGLLARIKRLLLPSF